MKLYWLQFQALPHNCNDHHFKSWKRSFKKLLPGLYVLFNTKFTCWDEDLQRKTYLGSSFLIPDTIAVRILCDWSTKCSGSYKKQSENNDVLNHLQIHPTTTLSFIQIH